MQRKISNYLKKNSSIKKLSFLLFPPRCVICGNRTNGRNICENCFKKIDFLDYPLIEHRKNVFFYAITNYEGVSGELVRSLKFRKLKSVSSDIAEIFADFIQRNNIKARFLTFVPMTPKERKSRGFNQSRLIARHLSQILNLELLSSLKKIKETKKQVGLLRRERIKNVKNAFIAEKIPTSGNVIIIDDVYTTGATAHSVAKVISLKTDSNIYFIAFSRKI